MWECRGEDIFLALQPHIRVCLIECTRVCVCMCYLCVCVFGLVSPASCSGEGNMLVRMRFFCHIRIDDLKLWSERESGRGVREKEQKTDRWTKRERERERGANGLRGGREERHCRREDGMNKQSRFSTPGACISL